MSLSFLCWGRLEGWSEVGNGDIKKAILLYHCVWKDWSSLFHLCQNLLEFQVVVLVQVQTVCVHLCLCVYVYVGVCIGHVFGRC